MGGYEQKTFSSKTDWRIRTISSSNLCLRSNHIYVCSDGVNEAGFTYVLAKNVLKKLIAISDLRTQIGGFLYGYSPSDNDAVYEIRAIVMPPQIGNHASVSLPVLCPPVSDNGFLAEYECLGWIHTQPAELQELSKNDILSHTKFLSSATNRWQNEKSIVMTCSFTPGSVTLTAYRLTMEGVDWGQNNQHRLGRKDLSLSQGMTGTAGNLYEKVQMLLSDRFMGFFMIPDTQSWNRNFVGVTWNESMRYGIKLGNPLPFYHEQHRPTHFLKFASIDREIRSIERQHEKEKNGVFNQEDETDQQNVFD